MVTKQLVFSADAQIRFRDGRILIHATSSGVQAFQSEQPTLVGWLCQFMRPTSVEAALVKLSLADRSAIEPVLEHLQRAGVLVQTESAAAQTPSAQAAHAKSRLHLQALARAASGLPRTWKQRPRPSRRYRRQSTQPAPPSAATVR